MAANGLVITAKGRIKYNKLMAKDWSGIKSLSREQRFNMWVFTTVTRFPALDLEFLFRYLSQGGDSWEAVLEKRDYFRWMVQRKEIQDS